MKIPGFDSLQMIFQRLLDETTTKHHRFLFSALPVNQRLVGLVGARGVGKTTLLLQLIKERSAELGNAFYFSADHLYFRENTVYELVEELYLKQSVRTVLIDEVHKYDNWNQELKNIYDGFPDIRVFFSGSSSLDLVKGSYDLSRRANIYHLPGLSFREYLNFSLDRHFEPIAFIELMNSPESFNSKLSKEPGILGHFHRYLKQGYYPFFAEDSLSYQQKLLRVIEKTIYEDVSNFYNLKTSSLRVMLKILNFLASIPPGEISSYNIGKSLKIDDKTATHYLQILKETGLVELIYPVARGHQILRKPEKVFLSNTNFYQALANNLSGELSMGTIRELAFVQAVKNSGFEIFYSKQGDYQIKDFTFEIGGKNKTKQQVKNLKNAFVVKDDIIVAHTDTIPLMFFGFLY